MKNKILRRILDKIEINRRSKKFLWQFLVQFKDYLHTFKLFRIRTYDIWIKENERIDAAQIESDIKNFFYTPKISIILPVFNTPPKILKKTLLSVTDQLYKNWELCIADGNSNRDTKKVIKKFSAKDKRIKVLFLDQNLGIAMNSNMALSLSSGEYIALMDHDDILPVNSLYEVAKLLQKNPEADLIYTDEDRISLKGKRFDPFFKPDWSPDRLLSQNYISHLGVYRHKLVKEIGGFRKGFDGSQDYDLVLRFTERTKNIFHIPKVLYYRAKWKSLIRLSRKKYTNAGKKAITEALERRKIQFRDVIINKRNGYSVRYKVIGQPLISIIIPIRDRVNLLKKCVHSILKKTTYKNYEIIIINNQSVEKETLGYFDEIKNDSRVRLLDYDKEFNYSAINNYAVLSAARGEYVLFLNNDTEIISVDWLEAMLELCQRDDIGAVGAKLLYPDNTIQHAGIALGGVGGVASNSYNFYNSNIQGYFGEVCLIRNLSAVTGACLMTKKRIFEEVGGFDEDNLKIAFNDVDLCMKIREKGYLIAYTPHAELYHYQSASRGGDDIKCQRFYGEINFMKKKWEKKLNNDPYYNRNRLKLGIPFSIIYKTKFPKK